MPTPNSTITLADAELSNVADDALCHQNVSLKQGAWLKLRPQIAGICAMVCRKAEDASLTEDVTQITCNKIINSCGGPSGYRRGHNFRPWCAQIARNAFLDVVTKRQPTTETDTGSELPEPPAPANQWGPFYDDATPLKGEELQKSRQLFAEQPETAVQVFAVSWLWRLLPATVWADWLGQLGIDLPWPPEEILQAGNARLEIMNATATKFGITLDAVRKNVERRRDFLLGLARVRSMLNYRE